MEGGGRCEDRRAKKVDSVNKGARWWARGQTKRGYSISPSRLGPLWHFCHPPMGTDTCGVAGSGTRVATRDFVKSREPDARRSLLYLPTGHVCYHLSTSFTCSPYPLKVFSLRLLAKQRLHTQRSFRAMSSPINPEVINRVRPLTPEEGSNR